MFNTTFFKELLLRNKQETKFKKNCEHYLIKRIPSQLEQETKLGGGGRGALLCCDKFLGVHAKENVEGNPLGDSIVGFFATAIVNQHPTSAPVGHSLP